MPPSPSGRGARLAASPPPPGPSPGAAGGAGDERELQSRAATADAARAIDCGTSAVQGCGQHRGVGETLATRNPWCSPRRMAFSGWLGVSEPVGKSCGRTGPQQASSTTALRGAKVTPLHPATAVGIQGRSHPHLALNINVSACEWLGCSMNTLARESLGQASQAHMGVPVPPGPAWVRVEPLPSLAAPGSVCPLCQRRAMPGSTAYWALAAMHRSCVFVWYTCFLLLHMHALLHLHITPR